MNVPDLFGGESKIVMPEHSPYRAFRQRNNYRKCEGKKSCRTCKYGEVWEGNTKKYRKCVLMGVSQSAATDVSQRCVCNRWEDIV